MTDRTGSPPITELSISYTLRCTSACRHCAVESSPERTEKLNPDDVLPLLPALHAHGVRRFLLTGGEPALYVDELAHIIRPTQSYGWRVAVFSNGFWAVSDEDARSWAADFRGAGIHHVFFSTSRYHREFVPSANILRAAAALERHHLTSHVHCHLDRTRNVGDLLVAAELAERGVPCSPFVLCPEGRARDLTDQIELLGAPRGQVPKERCALQHQIFIDTGGVAMRCCAAADRMERLENRDFYCYGDVRQHTIEEILDGMAPWTPLFALLNREGPAGVWGCLAGQLAGTGFSLRDRYYSHCDLCTDLLGNPRVLHVVRDMFRIPPP
ncbi:MAG: radical SAM protein [Candidatus Eisenbacteria bacterium]|jgi:hypothetical protein|nr:radical SAM protein [Candidatus Eisenbacteria bacterium]